MTCQHPRVFSILIGNAPFPLQGNKRAGATEQHQRQETWSQSQTRWAPRGQSNTGGKHLPVPSKPFPAPGARLRARSSDWHFDGDPGWEKHQRERSSDSYPSPEPQPWTAPKKWRIWRQSGILQIPTSRHLVQWAWPWPTPWFRRKHTKGLGLWHRRVAGVQNDASGHGQELLVSLDSYISCNHTPLSFISFVAEETSATCAEPQS